MVIKEKKVRNNERNMQDFWDTIKSPNLLIFGIGENNELQTKGVQNICGTTMAQKFQNHGKYMDTQI
jgi:hypothetical protein